MGGPGEAPAELIDFSLERGRHRRFVGRDDVLARRDAWLLGPDDTGWGVVTGGPGMGREAAGAVGPRARSGSSTGRRQRCPWITSPPYGAHR